VDDTAKAIVLQNGRAGKRSGERAGVEVEEESGKGDVKRRRFAVNLR